MSSLTVPPFSFARVPTPEEIAAKLVCGVLPGEREDARALLVDSILPLKLAPMASHPRPERLVAVVYKELARVISGKPPNMRLHTLRVYAFEAYIQYMVREATNMAVARYCLDRPGFDPSGAGHWLTPQVEELRTLEPADLAELARRSLDAVAQWHASVAESFPAVWPRLRDHHHLVSVALECARSGAFQEAAGPLHQFLCEVGESPREVAPE